MKILTSLSICLLLSISASAQGAEKVELRVVYNGTWEVFEGFKDDDRYGLDIGKDAVVFYDWSNRCIKMELAGISENSAGYWEKLGNLTKKYGGGRDVEYAINLPSQGLYTANDHAGPYFFNYTDSIPLVQWELEDSTRLICEYECSKAVGQLNGRTWTVWYSPDIPLSYGPHILGGLPGLILAASDSNGVFCFEAEGIERPNDGSVVELINTKKAQRSTRKQVRRLRAEYNEMTNGEYFRRAMPDWPLDGHVERFGKDVTHEKVEKNFYFDE